MGLLREAQRPVELVAARSQQGRQFAFRRQEVGMVGDDPLGRRDRALRISERGLDFHEEPLRAEREGAGLRRLLE